MSEYLEKIIENLSKIETEESSVLLKATQMVAEVIRNDGIIFTFGCGSYYKYYPCWYVSQD